MKNKLKAFTLIEVLIALLILGIGISFLYAMFPLGIRISKEVQMLGRISFFAQKKIEELKTSNETVSDLSGQEADFNWTINIRDYNTEDNLALKKLQLDFEWLQGSAVRRKTFITYFKN
jgi:prepilin-type N-terminal cleavage/methylation domain-containing protein